MEPGLDLISLLIAAAFIAGMIDAVAGGGGLITIPALLAAGVPPVHRLVLHDGARRPVRPGADPRRGAHQATELRE